MKIGFIGIGSMGMPLAQNLLAAGHDLQVYNRTRSKIDKLGTDRVTPCATPAEAAIGAELVVSMLSDDDAVRSCVTGPQGVLSTITADTVHISMSTILPETSQQLASLHEEKNSHYLAAPVFGRPDAVAMKKVWICISGAEAARQKAKPLLEGLSVGVFDFGSDPGAANIIKITGNFMILALLEATAEAFTLTEKYGLDRMKVAEFFGATTFNMPLFHNYGKMIARKEYTPVGFKARLGYKDARLALKLSQNHNTPMPFVTTVHNRLLTAMAKGRGDSDWVEGIARGVSEDAGT